MCVCVCVWCVWVWCVCVVCVFMCVCVCVYVCVCGVCVCVCVCGVCVWYVCMCVWQTGHTTLSSTPYRQLDNQAQNTTDSNHLYNTLELLMMGIMVPETCWASNKICNKNYLLHLVSILFPHINDDARSKSHQIKMYPVFFFKRSCKYGNQKRLKYFVVKIFCVSTECTTVFL